MIIHNIKLRFFIYSAISLSAFARASEPKSETSDRLNDFSAALRYHYLADPSLLKDGDCYLNIRGGFAGDFYEFVDMNNQNRSSLALGESIQGEKFYRKKMLFPFGKDYGDPNIVNLRTALRNFTAKNLPSEIEEKTGDDSEVMFIIVNSAGKLRYWVRTIGGIDKPLPKEFQDIYDLAMKTKSLVPSVPTKNNKGFGADPK